MKRFKKIIKLVNLFLFVFMVFSCEPRIEFDEGQWGNNAVITEVLLFKLHEQEHQLQEYHDYGETTTGIQRRFLSTDCLVNNETANVVVKVPSDTDMTEVGLVIRHKAKKIEPVNEAPKPGYLDDFSKGPYVYRAISTDGTERDWTIIFDLD